MPELLPDEYLHFAIYDAMRGLRVPALKRVLTEEERRYLADAVFARIKRSRWIVSFEPDGRSAHTAFGSRGE